MPGPMIPVHDEILILPGRFPILCRAVSMGRQDQVEIIAARVVGLGLLLRLLKFRDHFAGQIGDSKKSPIPT